MNIILVIIYIIVVFICYLTNMIPLYKDVLYMLGIALLAIVIGEKKNDS